MVSSLRTRSKVGSGRATVRRLGFRVLLGIALIGVPIGFVAGAAADDPLLPSGPERLAEQIETARSRPLPGAASREDLAQTAGAEASGRARRGYESEAPSAAASLRTAASDAAGESAGGLPGGKGLRFALLAGAMAAASIGAAAFRIHRRGRAPITLGAHLRAAAMVSRRPSVERPTMKAPAPPAAHRDPPATIPVPARSRTIALAGPSPSVAAAAQTVTPAERDVRMERLESSLLVLAETVRELTVQIPRSLAPAEPEDWDRHLDDLLEIEREQIAEIGPCAGADPRAEEDDRNAGELANGGATAVPSATRSRDDGIDLASSWEHFLAGGLVLDPGPAGETRPAGGLVLDPGPAGETRPAGGPALDPAPAGETRAPGETRTAGDGTAAVRRVVRSRIAGRGPLGPSELEARREEVLDLAGAGVSVPEICSRVGLGRHEVQLILKTLFDGRGAQNRAAESGAASR